MMLSLRMEACSSIGAISTVMRRFAFESSSTGSISQLLSRIGGCLPTTLSTENGVIRYLVFASDEIFSKTIPILVSVDPVSSAILRIELSESRKAEDWKRHFECLHDNGLEAVYLVSDDGQGIRAGHAEALSDVVRQSDTYHAVAHRLGNWAHSLETGAYKAIGVEHACERKLTSAKAFTCANSAGSLGRNPSPPPTRPSRCTMISATSIVAFSASSMCSTSTATCVIDNRPKQASRPALRSWRN